MTEVVTYTKNVELSNQFPEFMGLTIYGSTETPLFAGQQVQDLLGITKIHYAREYDEGDDYIKVPGVAKDGKMREQNMFTEHGLYNIIFRSNTDLSKKFRKFVTIVLRELRTMGSVTLRTALAKLQADIKVKEKSNEVLDTECETLKETIKIQERDHEEYRAKYYNECQKVARLEKAAARLNKEKAAMKLQNHKTYQPTTREGRLWAKAKEKCLTPLYFVHVDAEDDSTPADDDEAVWKLVKSQPAAEDHSFTVHVFKDVTPKAIHDALIANEFGVKTKSGVWSANKYRGSLDSISHQVENVLLGETAKPWPAIYDD